MSPYNYSFNNPVVFNDPSGQAPEGGDIKDELNNIKIGNVNQEQEKEILSALSSIKEKQPDLFELINNAKVDRYGKYYLPGEQDYDSEELMSLTFIISVEDVDNKPRGVEVEENLNKLSKNRQNVYQRETVGTMHTEGDFSFRVSGAYGEFENDAVLLRANSEMFGNTEKLSENGYLRVLREELDSVDEMTGVKLSYETKGAINTGYIRVDDYLNSSKMEYVLAHEFGHIEGVLKHPVSTLFYQNDGRLTKEQRIEQNSKGNWHFNGSWTAKYADDREQIQMGKYPTNITSLISKYGKK